MPQTYTLRRSDGQPLGTLEGVQATIRRIFPSVRFEWRPSGAEKLRSTEAKIGSVPDALRTTLEKLPPMLQGTVDGDGFDVTFILGPAEPVDRLDMQLGGGGPTVEAPLTALEVDLGSTFVPGAGY